MNNKRRRKYKVHRFDYKTPEYREWKRQVVSRAKNKCEFPNCPNGGKQCHHVKPHSKYPELRYSVENGRYLCLSCHYKIKGKEEQFARAFEQIKF
jgi:hypothetical protein